ncbi:hypothetical protein BDZ97DRAFT_1924321 [Flammula alnicola]|nr:hypothetical protein BDZ97DRAFT_1924321 [Flammula alnicola]
MASVDRQRNLPSYPDIMQKVKLLDVIRGAPGATLANYAQPLEETAHLMSKWSSHTSTVASNPGAAQASPMSPTSLLSSRMLQTLQVSEKAAAVCALHLSIQPRSLKEAFNSRSRGKGAMMISRRPPLLVLVRLLLRSLSKTTTDLMKVDGDQLVFSDTVTDPGISPLGLPRSVSVLTLARDARPLAPNLVPSFLQTRGGALTSPARSDSDSSKRARTEDSYVFGDSAILVEEVLAKASALVSNKTASSGDELAHRKHREILLKELKRMQNNLDLA